MVHTSKKNTVAEFGNALAC